jgi:peptide/nickel transport system permease protein
VVTVHSQRVSVPPSLAPDQVWPVDRVRRRAPTLLGQIARQRLGGVGLVVVAIVAVCAIAAPLLAPYDPAEQILVDARRPPSLARLFGTDEFGRDVFSRVLYGARVSLQVGVTAVAISSVVGTLLGLLAGYRGGLLDEVLMRIMDGIYSFPALILALIINSILGSSLTNVIIAIAIVATPAFARLARGSTLALREREFVHAARTVGASTQRILGLHIVPNILGPLIVNATNQISGAIVTEGSLSFLGLGVQPPTPAWGSMLRAGYGFMDLAPWLALAPGLAITVTVLGFNFLGDAMRDALDPYLRERPSA